MSKNTEPSARASGARPSSPPLTTVRRVTIGFKSGKEQVHALNPHTSEVHDDGMGVRIISTATSRMEVAMASVEYWIDQTVTVKEPEKQPDQPKQRANVLGRTKASRPRV